MSHDVSWVGVNDAAGAIDRLPLSFHRLPITISLLPTGIRAEPSINSGRPKRLATVTQPHHRSAMPPPLGVLLCLPIGHHLTHHGFMIEPQRWHMIVNAKLDTI